MYEVVQLLLITHTRSLKKCCQYLFCANVLNSLNCGMGGVGVDEVFKDLQLYWCHMSVMWSQ